jgi:DNA polymerase III alpha subunit
MSEKTPQKYISLHNHSNFSCNDALGYPDDIFSFCIENGISGHALTDHGNMSGYARSQLLVEGWHKSGKEFRYLPGIEAYFHPDLEQWKLDKLQHDDEKAGLKKKSRTPVETQLNITRSSSDDIVDIDTSSAIVIENEDESKSTKHFNPVNRRHHLVLLPKNSQGLQELFHLTSRSFLEGLYRFPRIDVKMVKETLTRGNVLASTACLHPDTMIWTDRGKITIEEVVKIYKNNERIDVMSWDEDKHEIVHRRVTWGDKTRYNTPIVEVCLMNGAKIKLTADHRLFTKRGWVEAGKLWHDDKILYRLETYKNYCTCRVPHNHARHCAQYVEWFHHQGVKAYKDNDAVEFIEIETVNPCGNSDVYDIEVVDTHNFFADDILVHNCISGLPGYNIFKLLEQYKFDELDVNLLRNKQTKENCVNAVGNAYEMLVDMFGKGDTYLELQFNKLAAQDIINLSLIEFAKRNGLTNKLLVTCDAHYYNPDVWREREIYKKLAYVSFDMYSPDLLPKSREELKCELYPKNHLQIWEEYKKAKQRSDLYDDSIDDLVCDAVERGHDIAFEEIGDVQPDRTIKLPKKLVPKDRTPIEHLSYLCIEGLKKRGLKGKREYVERIKEELEVIEFLNMAEYFITYQKVIELAREVTLVGPARGSGGGSLVNYVLYITELDPIRWKLPFSRFLSKYRQGMADIDTDIGDRDKVLDVLRKEFGNTNVIPISNYNLLKVKSLIKDLSKFYGIPFEEANRATASVEHEVRKATLKEGDDKNLFVLTYDAAMEYSKSFRDFIEAHPEIGASMKILFKQNKSLSRHAGGVLIADDIAKQMPLIMSGGEPQSPWTEGMNVKELEKIAQWIKMDILGLSTLRLIENSISLILENELVNVCIDGINYKLNKNDKVKLTNGQYVFVRELKISDDVVIPIEKM